MGHGVHGLVKPEPLEDSGEPLADHRVRGGREEVAPDSEGLQPPDSLEHRRDASQEVIVK